MKVVSCPVELCDARCHSPTVYEPWVFRSILTGMPALRAATAADAAIITHHRRRMFVDAGRSDNRVLDVMAEHFHPWVTQQLQSGNYMGWLALDDAGEVIGGSGLM